MNEILCIIIERLAIKRTQLDLSQEKLAELCNLHRNYIGNIERGEKRPSLETLIKIAKAMNMKLEDLFKGL